MIEHIKHIKTSGTIVRSSPFLISRLLRAIDFRRARTVVQLGVGTGCITRALLKKLHPDARLLGLELNQVFVEENRDLQDPRLHLVQGCASALPRFAREHGLGEVDYIVSSLPLAIMNKAIVERILRDAGRLLAPHGMFLQYQYSLSQRRALERRFREVKVGFTLANIPPAFVYECTPELPAAPAAGRRAAAR
ncbi:MAG: methyltransferase domain-containing protein [Gemmatimonadaceae bacterium]|nr:methyltransferase domain-containing protein [Gemmatimonadaceae bacterium]